MKHCTMKKVTEKKKIRETQRARREGNWGRERERERPKKGGRLDEDVGWEVRLPLRFQRLQPKAGDAHRHPDLHRAFLLKYTARLASFGLS